MFTEYIWNIELKYFICSKYYFLHLHYLLNKSYLYCILRSYFILKNVAVHPAASVNIKDETWNSVYDRPHDALEDDIDINIWSDIEKLPYHMIY